MVREIADIKKTLLDDADKDILHACWFCEYAERKSGVCWETCAKMELICKFCPGRDIEKHFSCMGLDHHYIRDPHAFLDKIEAMNGIRIMNDAIEAMKQGEGLNGTGG